MKNKWTAENIKDGFHRFFIEHGKYPTVLEIDMCEYLPSSRQIQRRWPGGVPALRKEIGLGVTDYTTGSSRSDIAHEIGRRGATYEADVLKVLIKMFGEVFVHGQHPFGDLRTRFDFFVYAKGISFAIDVFYAKDKHSFIGCLNQKIRSYAHIPHEIVLLQVNERLDQEFDTNKFIESKRLTLPKHCLLMNLESFYKYIAKLEPLRICTHSIN